MSKPKIIDINGNITEMSSKKITLKEAQNIVGGWVESMNIGERRQILMNEEGMMTQKINYKASEMISQIIGYPINLYGNIILCTFSQF